MDIFINNSVLCILKVCFRFTGDVVILGSEEKIFSVDIGGRENWVFRGRPLWEGFICIVARSRVHFAACIDPVVFFLLLNTIIPRNSTR